MNKKVITLILVIAFCVVQLIPTLAYTPDSDKIVYQEDFEYADKATAKTEIDKLYYFELGTYWTDAATEPLKKDGDNTYLFMPWSAGRLMRGKANTAVELRDSYTLSLDVKATGTNHDGGWVFVRTTTTPYTTAHTPPQVINEYESDGYNDGKYSNGVGATGVYIKPHGTKLQIGVRTQETIDDTTYKKGIGRVYVELDTPNAKNVNNNFFALRVEDYNNTIKIFADDTLIAQVEYLNSNGSIYTKAIIKDAEGETLKTIDNARIAHKSATFAIANRGGQINVDNIVLEKNNANIYKKSLFSAEGNAPIQCVTDLAVQFTATEKFVELIVGAPNYSNNIGNLTFSLYKWNESYEKTLAGDAIAEFEHVNYPDSNPGLSLDVPTQEPGEYLLFIENTTEDPEEQVGVWASNAIDGLQTYVAGAPHATLTAKVSILYINNPSTSFGEISKIFGITVADGISGGTVEAKATAYAGEKVAITVTPDAGMKLKSLKVNGTDVSNNEFVMPSGDATITAEFEAVTVTPPPTNDSGVIAFILVSAMLLIAVIKKRSFSF